MPVGLSAQNHELLLWIASCYPHGTFSFKRVTQDWAPDVTWQICVREVESLMSWARCHLYAHLSWCSCQPHSPLVALGHNYTCRFPQSGWEWYGGVACASDGLCPGLGAAQLLYHVQLAPRQAVTPSQGPVSMGYFQNQAL